MNDPIAYELVVSWTPRALAIAAAAAGVLALFMSRPVRWRFAAGYFLLYLPVPLILVALAHGPFDAMDGFQRDPTHVHLGLAYMFVVLVMSAYLALGVWLVAKDRGDRIVALSLAVAALAVYLVVLPYQPAVRDLVSDEPHYLVFTQSLWLDQDLNLANDYTRDPYMGFWPERLPDVHAVWTAGGLFPIREPGFPLLLVVPFGLAGRYGVLRMLVVLGVVLVVQLYFLLRDVGIDRRVAAPVVLVVALTHPLISYTTQVFPELPVALGLVTAARVLRRGPNASALALGLASAIAGLMPWLTVRALPLGVAVVACAIVWATDLRKLTSLKIRRLAAAVVPFTMGFGALGVLNQSMFGDWTPGAGARLFYVSKPFVSTPTFAPQIGGLGLFIDRVFGLFRNSPEYVLVLIGVVPLLALLRRRSPIAIVLCAASVPYLVAIANFFYWHADWSPPPRYLVSVLPALVLLFALAWARLRQMPRAAIAVAGSLCLLSVGTTYLFLAHPSLMYNWGTLEVAVAWTPGVLGLFLQRWLHVDPGALYPSLWWPDAWSFATAAAWLIVGALLIAAGRSHVTPTRKLPAAIRSAASSSAR